jgi:energy-coupling factor transporter ATP-binding protein EcfA2
MIKLIVGHKGSGKTKTLIRMANEAAEGSKGNVICVEKGAHLTYDLSYRVRLIDIDHYGISGYDPYFGFLCGLMAGNYDITDIFCDGTLKICGRDTEAFAQMVEHLLALTTKNELVITFTVSCELEDLPERIRQFAV